MVRARETIQEHQVNELYGVAIDRLYVLYKYGIHLPAVPVTADGMYKYGIHLTPGLAEVSSTLRS